MTEFLHEVRDEYDVILVDTPPILPVTDSAIVAGQADGVVLVYQAGKVGRLVLKRAKAHLESARAKVWGVVLNDVQTEIAGYAYSHYYTHYYGEETVVDSSHGAPAAGLGGFVPRRSLQPRGRRRGGRVDPDGTCRRLLARGVGVVGLVCSRPRRTRRALDAARRAAREQLRRQDG